MIEVEKKFRCVNPQRSGELLMSLDATFGADETHEDTYLRHPCRDFAVTNEALRIRRVNGEPFVTYKGPKVSLDDATLKARKELEWPLTPGDHDGSKLFDLFESLGFNVAATVKKTRRVAKFAARHSFARFTITLDSVESVGSFAEIECLCESATTEELTSTAKTIDGLASKIELGAAVEQSYLAMLLANQEQ